MSKCDKTKPKILCLTVPYLILILEIGARLSIYSQYWKRDHKVDNFYFRPWGCLNSCSCYKVAVMEQ